MFSNNTLLNFVIISICNTTVRQRNTIVTIFFNEEAAGLQNVLCKGTFCLVPFKEKMLLDSSVRDSAVYLKSPCTKHECLHSAGFQAKSLFLRALKGA